MTKRELIQALEKFSDVAQVMILDGHNGGGYPREINLGPVTHVVADEDALQTADCEDLLGDEVVVLGYGCY